MKSLVNTLFYSLCLLLAKVSLCQTVGTIVNSELATDKLTLLNPFNSKSTYLIDNCGYVFNHWNSDYTAGMSAQLDREGALFRLGRLPSDIFRGGGIGGVLEKYSWTGDLEWTFTLADSSMHLHHDLELMPDGNILLIAWELISEQKLLEFGRNNVIPNQLFYSEVILEIDPDQNMDVVWEWHAIDHVIQSTDDQLSNYGQPEVFVERIDINLNQNSSASFIDWLHINSISYRSDLDQIMLSCNGINEVFIIDHSADTEETTGPTGGNARMGGDIIYRWGAPSNYNNVGENILAKQHDAKWVINDLGEYDDAFTIFNNGLSDVSGNFSALMEVSLPRQGFNYTDSKKSEILWSYNSDNKEELYSKRMSGLTKLSNNHVIFCESDSGSFLEIDESGALLWKYINPISGNSLLSQGDEPTSNIVFNVYPYEKDFFKDISLVNTYTKIEEEWLEDCFLSTSDHDALLIEESKIIVTGNMVEFRNIKQSEFLLQILDVSGKVIDKQWASKGFKFNISHLPSGIYIILVQQAENLTSKMISRIE